jgi:hypothetical protein
VEDGLEAEVVGRAVEVVLADLEVVEAAAEEPVVVGKNSEMRTYVIDVSKIEELQTLNDKHELEKIFIKAQSTIVNGEQVVLVRKDKNGSAQKFDQFSTLEDLARYKSTVFKYL